MSDGWRSDALFIKLPDGPLRKHRFQQFLYCCVCIRCCGDVFTEALPSNASMAPLFQDIHIAPENFFIIIIIIIMAI
jgi:hypothetical protein